MAAISSSGIRWPPPPPPGAGAAVTATSAHHQRPFGPPASAAIPGLNPGVGSNPAAAAAAAAAAADYASWLCRPLSMPAAAGGYLPLPANLLAARLSKLYSKNLHFENS